MFFVIDYDRRVGQIVTLRTFDESQRDEAYDARLALELDMYRQGLGREREIVLLDAASEDALRKTHARYFYDLRTLANQFLDALKARLAPAQST